MGASYLVRFDDICPTMNWSVWDRIEPILDQAGVRPIMAVVPENADPRLAVEPPNPRFWERVRRWRDRGWTIGMHGYQHRYVSRDAGLIGLRRQSEFAGLPAREQETKLRQALELFERQEVVPRAWVAPSHSFDRNTVTLLARLGIPVISDGLSVFPFTDGSGLLWIPQQLWRFHTVPFGVWTVCCHHNRWTTDRIATFERALRRHRSTIVDVDTIVEQYGKRRPGLGDRLVEHLLRTAFRASGRWRALVRGVGNGRGPADRIPVGSNGSR